MELCPEHAYLKADVTEIKDDVKRVVVGMYGPLDNPDAGLINHVKNDMAAMKEDIAGVKKDVADLKGVYTGFKKTVVRGLVWAGGIITTIITALGVACATGMVKP